MMFHQLNIINYQKYLDFPLKIWILSRLIICFSMLIIAPLFPNPNHDSPLIFGWDVFFAWDSSWYESIAKLGYPTSNNPQEVIPIFAFFPLFPLLIKSFMFLGFSASISGILINNLAFLATLIVLYNWIEQIYDQKVAKLTVQTLALCPYSLYGTVIYTEGLFLLCSTMALKTFHEKNYIWSVFWGTLSTAIRSPGINLIPAFLFISWKEKRGIKSYITSFAVALGIILYSIYCYLQVGNFFAFIHAQKAWRGDLIGFVPLAWWKMLMYIVIGYPNWEAGYIKYPLHPMGFFIIVISAFLLWKFRQNIGIKKLSYSFSFLWILLWSFVGDQLFKITIIFGGFYLVCLLRNKIPPVTFIYAIFSYILILNTGITPSAERYAYGIITVSIAFGILLEKYPQLKKPSFMFFTILMVDFSIRFARNLWVA